MTNGLLKTDIDKFIALIDKVKYISIKDAAKQLNLPYDQIEEWSKLLEKENYIEIEYKLTVPYIIKREFSNEELKDKLEEFNIRKDVIVGKGEKMLELLDKGGEKLEKLRVDMDKLKREVKAMPNVSNYMPELDRMKKERAALRKTVYDQARSFLTSAQLVKEKILDEHDRYEMVTDNIKREDASLTEKETNLLKLQDIERDALAHTKRSKEFISSFTKRFKTELKDVTNSASHLRKLTGLAEKLRSLIMSEKKKLTEAIKAYKKKDSEVKYFEKKVVEKFGKSGSSSKTKDLARFLKTKETVETLWTRAFTHKEEIKRKLEGLMTKARTIAAMSKSRNINKSIIASEIKSIEGNFKELTKKMQLFEKELEKLSFS